jgi:hypothetical protein
MYPKWGNNRQISSFEQCSSVDYGGVKEELSRPFIVELPFSQKGK